jgi:hypothetical protein
MKANKPGVGVFVSSAHLNNPVDTAAETAVDTVVSAF